MTDKLEHYHAAQSWLTKNSEIYNCPRQRALEIICAKICETMNIQRVGIWQYSTSKVSMIEELTYCLGDEISKGTVVNRDEYPIYFGFAEKNRVVVSNDTHTDLEMSEFLDSYMIPLGVTALLDAPIFSDGEMIGVVCCEATDGPREWDIHDKYFAASCSDLIGRFFETEKRHYYERELKHRIHFLENDLLLKIENLNEAKLSLDLALEGAQAGKWDWDIKSGKLNLNKTWFTRLGYAYDELPQDLATFKKVLHPDDVEKTFKTLDKHLSGETLLYECRYRMITKSGEIQWCIDRGCITKRAVDGTPLFATGVNVNITPIVQLEHALISSEIQLKAMIRSLPAPVAMFDRKLRYLAYSSRWEEEWQQFGDIKMGIEMANISGENRIEWIANMELALKGEVIRRDEDLVQISADEKLWLKWIIQPWKLANGKIGGVVVMAENITARIEAEMKIAQASKLSALGEMAGGIAHEINNPLSIIKGYIDLLKRHSSRDTLTEVLMHQYIEKMDTTVERISRIVIGMRRFSRESSMDEKAPYSLNQIIDESLDICLERFNNNGIALKVEYFTGEPIVECRSVEISQVLINLINNSFQAIVSLPHPWIRIDCRELLDSYELKISDCGRGIPVNVQKKLFQPFFTTKNIGVGTGLGLSISRRIIEEHEGQLEYLADAPHTTFVITLPKLSTEDN